VTHKAARRWTPDELARTLRNMRCAECKGMPLTCTCKRTTEDIAMWLEDLATMLRRYAKSAAVSEEA